MGDAERDDAGVDPAAESEAGPGADVDVDRRTEGNAEEEYTRDIERERDELLETVRRVQADFENFRKRTLREQTERIERATEGLVDQLLPVLDNFELALVSIEDSPATEKVRKGVELVFAELLGTLEKAGLQRIEADGATFDPNEHEAVMHIPGEIEGDPVVAETVRTGYKLKDRVLRPAMVKVAGV